MRARLFLLVSLLFFQGVETSASDNLLGSEITEESSVEAKDPKEGSVIWPLVVSWIADEIQIDDLELADRIARAIEKSSNEFGVSPWLLVSLIRVESAGNPNAISYMGARGLTQIMPATGLEIANDLGIEWEGVEMLYDIETNIHFGTYYISKLLNQFDGNIHAAVAAYNWGPQHIAGRMRKGSALPVVYPGKVLRPMTVSASWASRLKAS